MYYEKSFIRGARIRAGLIFRVGLRLGLSWHLLTPAFTIICIYLEEDKECICLYCWYLFTIV